MVADSTALTDTLLHWQVAAAHQDEAAAVEHQVAVACVVEPRLADLSESSVVHLLYSLPLFHRNAMRLYCTSSREMRMD